MGVADPELETEIRHVAEEFLVVGQEYPIRPGDEKAGLRLRRIERHAAERGSSLDSNHEVIVKEELGVQEDGITWREFKSGRHRFGFLGRG